MPQCLCFSPNSMSPKCYPSLNTMYYLLRNARDRLPNTLLLTHSPSLVHVIHSFLHMT
ncbi:hypothetical protein MtrunA17_Chr8g0337641 [Medicago truncatula]|uniref:Uncharacterized protein n=1 Tax=Medicago truncatula TaxID=3880 RepID=A0A396GJL2_MEDTR|nr:hypothetical protein MtrunA17_Chr8g0337641 [Medicago truncatula]